MHIHCFQTWMSSANTVACCTQRSLYWKKPTAAVSLIVASAQSTRSEGESISLGVPTCIASGTIVRWVGTNIVASIRVHDTVMSEAEVLAQFEAQKLQFNPVTLHYERSGSDLLLTWSQGILESADEMNGVYTPVSGATSPYTHTGTGARKFFRVRVP